VHEFQVSVREGQVEVQAGAFPGQDIVDLTDDVIAKVKSMEMDVPGIKRL
jgi:hypothetical protein